MTARVAAVLWLVGVAAAQAPSRPTAPVEVGRASAFGGECRKILVAQDQRHALTVGSHGDLCWWDLERREVLRYVPPRERYVTAVALHPVRGMTAVSWTDGTRHDGSPGVVVIDLETGAAAEWSPGQFDKRQFDASGRRLAARAVTEPATAQELLRLEPDALAQDVTDAAPQLGAEVQFVRNFFSAGSGAARSPNGEHAASIVGTNVRTSKLRLDGATYALPCPETQLEHVCVTDAGLAIADDQQGQLHFVMPDGTTHLRAPHRGTALSLVFSPDGRHLAVHGLGAVRIVALDGTEELQLQGSHVVVPGEAGGEFRIFERHRSWRFDAGSRREVGECVTWQEPAIPMVHWLPGAMWPRAAGGGLTSPFRTGCVTMVDGAPWFADNNSRTDLYRWTAQGWNQATTGLPFVSGPLLLAACGERVLLATCHRALDDDSTSSTVTGFDLDGHETWRAKAAGDCDWAVPDPEHRRLWLGHGDQVLRLDLVERSTVEQRPERTWLTAGVLPDGALLASDGQGLAVADPDSLEERHRWPNPDGWKSIDVLTVAPDGRHVAIAHGCDVRILRLP